MEKEREWLLTFTHLRAGYLAQGNTRILGTRLPTHAHAHAATAPHTESKMGDGLGAKGEESGEASEDEVVVGVRGPGESAVAPVTYGRFLVRAVARLLLCKESGETVLFIDKPYDEAGGTPSPEVCVFLSLARAHALSLSRARALSLGRQAL